MDLPQAISVLEEEDGLASALWVTGGMPVLRADGQPMETRNRMTLCRCGRSSSKPLCDGTHRKIDFREDTRLTLVPTGPACRPPRRKRSSMHPEEAHEQASSLDQAVSTFVEVRPRLFGVAYRMLGSAAEAEDIVQDTWLRWQRIDRSTIDTPAAYLALITTRLSINAAQSARSRRETYIGPWLPEPVDTSTDPAVGAERGEALELALLLLLEKLTPTQRAAYVLREAFVYPYEQIAEILQLSPANVRQLVSRARRQLNTARRESIDKIEHRRLLAVFLDAAQTGNVAALEDLFAADVVSSADGGGIRGAARFPLSGIEQVAKFVASFAPRYWPGADITWVEVNGRAGVLVPRGRSGVALLTIEASPDGIHHLMWIVNPAKLEAFQRSRSRATGESDGGSGAPASRQPGHDL